MRKLLIALTVSVSLFFAQSAVSDVLRTDHPTEYVVVKGDTLWDISARFLEKPWLWPEIWQKNPQVKDPHWIYPGDVIRLTYVDGKPVLTINQMPNTNATPVGAIDVDLYNRPFLQDLRIVSSFKSLPYVIGVDEAQLLGSDNRPIYVKGLQGVAIGETVEIFRPTRNFGRNYKDDKQRSLATDLNKRGDQQPDNEVTIWQGISSSANSSDYIGTEMRKIASGKVTQISGEITRVFIEHADREIRPGDRVTPNSGSEYDPYYFPSKGPNITQDVRIMAFSGDAMHGGGRSVIAIPIGSKQGVKNGNTYSIWSQPQVVADTIAHSEPIAANFDKHTMIQENIATAMVFRTFDNVSYAIIYNDVQPVSVGDYLKNPE